MTFRELKNKLKNHTVGIAGAGGLGSNCAVALSRIGIGRLIIADFDFVSESNLNRQYFFRDQIGQKKVVALADTLQRINPDTIVEAHDIKIIETNVENLFATCDVVVEAFDLAETKQMLTETMLDKLPDTPLVLGVGMAGWDITNKITVNKYGKLYTCGDGVSEISHDLPPVAPKVGMVANLQANTVLQILLNES